MNAHPQERLCAFLDDELSPAERAQVEQHLAACAACAQELSELALVDRMGRELEVTAPEGYFETLPARLRPRLRAARKRALPPWVLALAAVALIGVLVPITWQRLKHEGPVAAVPSQERVEGYFARESHAPAPSAQPEPRMAPPQAVLRELRPNEAARAPAGAGPQSAPPARALQPTAAPETRDQVEALGYNGKTGLREDKQAAPTGGADDARQRGFGVTGGLAQAPPSPPPPAMAPPPATTPPVHAAPAVPPPATTTPLTRLAPGLASAPPPAAVGVEEAVVVPRTTTGTTSREEGRAAAKREQDKQDKDRYREDGAGEKAADELRLDDQPRRKALADAETFEGIAARSMQTAAEARQQRRVWRAFADAHRHDPQADEARVRAVEAAALAYRLSGEPADWQTLENDVRAYLKRSDAQQKERVRQLAPASRP